MEKESLSKVEKPRAETKEEKPKQVKLTFKEKIALEKLPLEIERIELDIEEKNRCLADPKCYEEIGISALAQELAKVEELYEEKMEELFAIEEKIEILSS
jgi:ATP-binding cassette subfamily F protein uup